RPRTQSAADPACQDYLAATSTALCEPAANDLLGYAFAFLRAVNVCRVEEVDLLPKGAIHDTEAISLAGFRPEIHSTKAQTADDEPRPPKMGIVHLALSFQPCCREA